MLTILVFQIVFIARVILIRISPTLKFSYYILNGIFTFIGMINKLIGFDKAWEMRKTIFLNLIIMSLGFLVIGCVLNGIEQCEDKEMKYDQKKLRVMELKQMSANEIKSIVKSLNEGILVIQNSKIVY